MTENNGRTKLYKVLGFPCFIFLSALYNWNKGTLEKYEALTQNGGEIGYKVGWPLHSR